MSEKYLFWREIISNPLPTLLANIARLSSAAVVGDRFNFAVLGGKDGVLRLSDAERLAYKKGAEAMAREVTRLISEALGVNEEELEHLARSAVEIEEAVDRILVSEARVLDRIVDRT